MKNHKKSKLGFTLIELIFAIVIVGIVVTSLPMMLNTTTNTISTNFKEKTFFNAFSLVSLIQTEEWDENNTKGNNYYKVLTADSGDSELKCIRKGVQQLDNDSGATCAEDNNKTSAIQIDEDANESKDDVSTWDDVDDFNNYSTIVMDTNISVIVRYMKEETDYSAKNIFFNENNSPATGTNLKFVQVEVRHKDTKELISVLKYTTANIGMVKIESRNE